MNVTEYLTAIVGLDGKKVRVTYTNGNVDTGTFRYDPTMPRVCKLQIRKGEFRNTPRVYIRDIQEAK